MATNLDTQVRIARAVAQIPVVLTNHLSPDTDEQMASFLEAIAENSKRYLQRLEDTQVELAALKRDVAAVRRVFGGEAPA